jgi:uncharacterized protein
MAIFKSPLFLVFLLFFTSCATYYQFNYEFNKDFEQGDIKGAESVLAHNKKAEHSKTRFLYLANRGVVSHLLGNYEESNSWLEEAYIFGEDYRKNYLNFTASYFLNPNLIVYPGEDHEHLMLLYYKSLNFLKMGNYDAALVECRRLNQRLYELADKYSSDNKYQKDAFIQNLMGIIYDASGDYNNAFIAYRNSLEIYQNEFKEMFNLSTPEQLKKDLMRTASLAGFPQELEQYRNQFGMDYDPSTSLGGDLIFLWHNGLAPVKEEWSLNFVAVKGAGGQVIFQNDELGLSFPFFYSSGQDGNASITDLTGTRIAFPKYVERQPYYHYANIQIGDQFIRLDKAEDINAIAFKTLKERMVKELATGLLRVALKKTVEQQVRKDNEGLGFLIGILNFASEKADTRNWQTLPHTIHYARIPLNEGDNVIKFHPDGSISDSDQSFVFQGKKGKTQFQSYQTLESKVSF